MPEVDPAVLQAAHEAAVASLDVRQVGHPVSLLASPGGEGGDTFKELERLRAECAAAGKRQQELEQQLAGERARASKESALSADLKDAKAARKEADARVQELDKQLKALQSKLGESEAKFHQLEANEARNRSSNEPLARQKELAEGQVADLRKELENALLQRKGAEEQSSGRSGELERTQATLAAERSQGAANLEKLALSEKARDVALQKLEQAARLHALDVGKLREALTAGEEKARALVKERDGARAAAKIEAEQLHQQLGERTAELERSALAMQESAKESERLRAELTVVKAEKWSAERGFAEEHERLLERLRSAEMERDTIREDSRLLARAAAEPDGELERMRGELSAALGACAAAERALADERAQMAGRVTILEQAREAAGERTKVLIEELAGLRGELEKANKDLSARKPATEAARGLSAEAEAELRQVLAKRDLEIQRLAAQLRAAPLSADASIPSYSFPGWLNGKAAALLSVIALAIGLLGGAALSRSRSEAGKATDPQPKGSPTQAVAPSSAPHSATGVSASPAVSSANAEQGIAPVGSSGAAASPTAFQVASTGGSLAASSAGMPSHLPDQFLGIRFGTELSEVAGIAQWKETAGKRHRKAELLGSEVEAVLTADVQNRLIMGSYVRVASRQPEALTPFLEWAVNVQDAVSALYGEPIRVHSVEGATEAGEVVRKIAAGEDFYQATWERESEDGMIDLSIRVFNERSVVFRMEYRARQLYTGFVEAQASKDGSKDSASPVPPSGKTE